MDLATDDTATQHPARAGRLAWWVPTVTVAGVALLLAGLGSWLVLLVTQVDGYRWDEQALVPADGLPHEVRTDGDQALIWSDESVLAPTCTVLDAASGEELVLEPTDGAYRRSGGTAGDWVGTSIVDAPSGAVLVSCALSEGSATSSTPAAAAGHGVLVAVEATPALPPWLAGLGGWVALPLTLAAAGALALFAGALARISNAARS